MFHTEAYKLPFRILREQEVIQLSGLQDFWNNGSLSDVELVPETLLRNVCGNCFHPALIGSALGSNTVLKSLVKGELEGPSKLVMNQAEAYAVFSKLCEQIKKEAKKRQCKKLQQNALPQVSQIHPSVVLLPKKVKVTKEMRFAQHCVAAASQLLTPQQTSALKNAGMQRVLTCSSSCKLSVEGLLNQTAGG